MHWWQYLIPDNPIALGVLYFLLILYALWMGLFGLEYLKVGRKKKHISDCESVKSLEDELKKQIAWRSGQTPNDKAGQEVSHKTDGRASFDTALAYFCKTSGIKEGSIVAEHIGAIFYAGWNNSQLQIESLIKNTSKRLFNKNVLLRSVLSLFIILGLLGTLFGLAHSLAQLLPILPSSGQISNNAVAYGLRDLLAQLRGAFAPSICGVGFTILGVLFFSFYSHRCQSVSDELERLTITVWVPRLYPSPFQQQLITLVQTEELIQQNRENIQNATKFASNIKTEVEDFGNEIKKARTTIKNLSTSSAQISAFADKFYASVEKLGPFQEELTRLYQKMMDDSTAFQEGVSKSLSDTTETQQQVRDTLTQQCERLKEVVERLRNYEDAYVKYEDAFLESRRELDETLRIVMEDARKAYSDIGERNQEIASAINESLSVPLRADLKNNLAEVNETLTTKLGSIVDRFGTFDAPITTAAQKFEQIVSTIDSRAVELMARLQTDYNKQNKANEDQLQKLASLNGNLVSFLQSLTNITSDQETSYKNLTVALPSLQEKLATLNENLTNVIAVGFPPREIGGEIDTAGIEREIREKAAKILSELDRLVRISDEIRRLQASQNGRKGTSQPGVSIAPGLGDQPSDRSGHSYTNPIYRESNPEIRRSMISRVKGAFRRLTGR